MKRPGRFYLPENETNFQRLYGSKNPSPYVKDAFHDYVILGRAHACNQNPTGTKMAPVYRLQLGPAQSRTIYLRLVSVADWDSKPGADPGIFDLRRSETDNFYSQIAGALDEESAKVFRQAAAGLLWSKQFYHYIVKDWLKGDALEPPPPASRWLGRNHDWLQVYSRDVISMPDKWEYPWFAAWDLAFHMLPSHISIQSSPSNNWNFSCVNGTCIQTGKFRHMNSRLPT
jgi:hypothetical protein